MSRQLLLEIIPAPEPTLDNTIVGSNTAAIEAASGLPPGRALYLWGPPGAGRSHILRAIAAEKPSVFFDLTVSAAEIMAWATRPLSGSDLKLVCVDDIQDMTLEQQASVFALYNRWRELAATEDAFALAVSGDRAPMMMSLREDLRTRLGWDLVFRLEPLSDQEKFEAIQIYAQRQGLPLSAEVLDWTLTHYSRDIRQLFALVDALDRYSLSKHRSVTVPLLRLMLADREFLQSSVPFT
jgi:DnaA family protein